MASGLINNINYSWADIKFVVFGVPVVGITEIEYGKDLKVDSNYGMGQEPISYGYGNNTYKASITVYKDWWMSVIAAAPNRDPTQIPPFDIQIVYGSSRVTASLDVLLSAVFTADALSTKQGDTKVMIKIPLVIAGIQHKY